MKRILEIILIFLCANYTLAQKDSLRIGDRYADDQIYLSVSYAQFFKQPTSITKSGFSYALSGGFIKDFILNKRGNFSLALGIGYGFDFFNHELKVEEVNNITVFNKGQSLSTNVFKVHNLEFPLEIRWRTSTARRYDFWRVYGGVKFLYNLKNQFEFNENSITTSYKNVSAFNRLQYGVTLSAGYDEFNVNIFYSLTPIFNNAALNGENINTSILKFGLIFYIL